MKKKINGFSFLKFLSIISIMCAHLSTYSVNSFINEKIYFLYDSIGALGVPIFFIISGFLFYNNKDKAFTFLKKKISRIFIPWLFIGTIVYISVFYFQKSLSLFNYFKFMIGYQSYLYYLTVLIILYLLYFKLKDNKIFLIITSIISVISIIIMCLIGIQDYSYLLIFNWMIYFNIGIILNKLNLFERYIEFCKKSYWIFGTIMIMLFIFFAIKNIQIGYFTFAGLLMIFINIFFAFGLCFKFEKNNRLVEFVSNNSLSFYLIHMPIAGIIVRLTNCNSVLMLMRLPITFCITYLVIYIYNIITNIECLSKYKVLLGLRNN